MKPGNFPEFPMSLEFYSGWILLLEGNADRFEWSVVKFVRIFLYLSFNVSFNVFILAFTQNFSFALEPSWTGNQEVIFHYFSPVLQNQCVQNIQKYSPIVFFFFFPPPCNRWVRRTSRDQQFYHFHHLCSELSLCLFLFLFLFIYLLMSLKTLQWLCFVCGTPHPHTLF